jgi:hypothetical protein
MLEIISFIILFSLGLIIVWLMILSLRLRNLENILSPEKFKIDIKENEDVRIHDLYRFWSKELSTETNGSENS